MRAVQVGDLSAFEQIVLRHQTSAWNFACRILNDHAEAEDVAQEAFLRVLDAAPRYQPTAKFRTFPRGPALDSGAESFGAAGARPAATPATAGARLAL